MPQLPPSAGHRKDSPRVATSYTSPPSAGHRNDSPRTATHPQQVVQRTARGRSHFSPPQQVVTRTARGETKHPQQVIARIARG